MFFSKCGSVGGEGRGRDPQLPAARGLGYLGSGLVVCRSQARHPRPASLCPSQPLSLAPEFVPSHRHATHPYSIPAGLWATREAWKGPRTVQPGLSAETRALRPSCGRSGSLGGFGRFLKPSALLDSL